MERLPVPFDKVQSVTKILAEEIGRPALLEILIESRLARSSRDELKRKFPDPTPWVQFVAGALQERERRTPALRALAILVERFADLPNVDHRLAESVKKAHRAAERGDIEKILRCVAKLQMFLSELRRIDLHAPTLAYLACKSEVARKHMADALINASPPPAVPREAIPETRRELPPTPTDPPPAVFVAPPPSLKEELERELTKLADEPLPASHVGADFASALPIPPQALRSLAGEQLRQRLNSFDEEAARIVNEFIRVDDGGAPRDVVTCDQAEARAQAFDELAKAAASVASDCLLARRDAAESARAVARALPRSHAGTANALADGIEVASSWLAAVESFDEYVERASALQVEDNQKLLALATEVAAFASRLPQQEADECLAQIVALVREGSVSELGALMEKVKKRSDAIIEAHEQMRRAARDVLQHLKGGGPLNLTEAARRNCVELVRRGEAPEAVNALAIRASEHPPSIARSATSERGPAIPSAPPESTIASDGVGLPALDVPLGDFRSRNRMTQTRIAGATEAGIGNLLLGRAFEEIAAGSVAGVIDHALDILALATRSVNVGEVWADVAFALLAAIPASPGSTQDWGAHAQYVEQTFRDRGVGALEDHFAGLINSSELDVAVPERFAYSELAPFAKRLAWFLWEHAHHAQHVLEDLGRGLARGLRYGDIATVRTLIEELAVHSGVAAELVSTVLQRATGATNKDAEEVARAARGSLGAVPIWLRTTVECFALEAQLLRARSLRPRKTTKDIHVQVPPRVQGGKMFVFRPGAKFIEIALLVSNPEGSGRSIVATELRLVTNRNPRWVLEQDAVAYVGSLAEDERVLALLRLPAPTMTGDREEVTLEYELRFRLHGTREYATQLGKIAIPIGPGREMEIDGYLGATGKPLILEGDALRLSSKSVQDARRALLESGLATGTDVAAVLVGRRRRGKTSLLETIAGDARVIERYTIVSDVLEDLPLRSIEQAFAQLGAILDRTAAKVGAVVPSLKERLEQGPASWQAVQVWLDELTAQLPKRTRVLLLIDEFQKWISELDDDGRTRILLAFRGLYNRPPNAQLSFSVVLSGLSNIKDYIRASQDFCNTFKVVPVRAFRINEIAALIRSNQTIEFDTRAVDSVNELSGGNPFLANLIGSIIANRLREQQRPYCFRDDVERAVKDELEDDQSRVWKFIEYLLKKGEEDHAAEIEELPALIALAKTIGARGSIRARVEPSDVKAELDRHGIECDVETLKRHLEACVQNELLVADEGRYGFATRWLAEWLAVMRDKLVPVTPKVDTDLVLGKYKLEKSIGEGGEGRAFEASDRRFFDRVVVVKIYARARGGGSLVAREAAALSRIDHPTIVRCIDYGVDESKGDVIVLERVHGVTLRELLAQTSASTSELVGLGGSLRTQVKFLEQLLHGLHECHRAGVVHKDLKPENIVVSQVAGIWVPKIIDFGLAEHVQATVQPTRGRYTTGYVAPERYRGEPRRAAADIYSLGVVAYELFTGMPPFGTDPVESQRLQIEGKFESLKKRRADVPQRLSEIVARMLASDAAQRPTAMTLAGELDAALDVETWTDLRDLGRKAYGDADAETAVEHLQRAALIAPDGERQTDKYIELLDMLLDAADACTRVPEVAQRIGQVATQVTLSFDEAASVSPNPLTKLATTLIKSVAVEPEKKEAKEAAVATLITALSHHAPHVHASHAVRALLQSHTDPMVWACREDIYVLGLHYRDCHLPPGLIESWCIAACRREREGNASLATAHKWLRRAERLGVSKSSEYLKERDELDGLLRKTANPVRLPAHAEKQEPAASVIGVDERGHSHYDRIVRWVERLLRLHPEVEAVRRVRKDGDIAHYPTRLLDTLPTIHQVPGVEPTRIIAAVLDASHCIPSACPMRINIILPKGRTVQERQAVFEKLQADSSLFGDAA